MKNILRFLFAAVLLALIEAKIMEHHCLPTDIDNLCVLENVFHELGGSKTHMFPKNYTHIYIKGRANWGNALTSHVWRFDSKLHGDLGQPPMVEIVTVDMEELEIPRKLQFGNFGGNYLYKFSVEDGETEPALSYLDLSDNYIYNLTNFTSLVNLQTLILVRNSLHSLDPGLSKLPKLKVLNLNHNSLQQLSASNLPPSLVQLQLFSNNLATINHSDISLPNLERLNLEHNSLKQINASVVILAMPKLKYLFLQGNEFTLSHMIPAFQILKQHNIKYISDADVTTCVYALEHQGIEGFCIWPEEQESASWVKAVGFSIIAVLVAVGFVLIVRWIYIVMNK